MTAVLQAILLGLTLLLAVPVVVLGLEVGAACWPRRRPGARGPDAPMAGARPPLAVLIPAHDEQRGIADTLRGIRAQLRPGDRLLVVADNCSDATASIGRAEGAEVVERRHETERGKGYALAFGVAHLRAAPPALVLIVDADCQPAQGAIDALAAACMRHDAPVQALNLMLSGPHGPMTQRVAEFAWRVKNWVRPRGGALLGLPCPLMGTGMALPWRLIESAPLASGSLAEDMQLGLELAQAGHATVFCEQALVTSRFPDSVQAGAAQRTRWEHGHLGVIGQFVPALLAAAWRQRSLRMLGLALDLAIPPLALLTLLVVTLWLAAGLLAWWGGAPWAWRAASALLLLLAAAVMAAWFGWGRAVLRPLDLLAIPGYAVSKLGLYLRFWLRRQRHWVRTDRE